MTQEEKRIKLAEAAGWTEIQWSELINSRIAIENKHFCRETEQFRCLWLPDYFNDLNAVHELEKYLTQDQANSCDDYLANSKQDGTWAGCHIWHQSAAQRAEALGLTLNLWK